MKKVSVCVASYNGEEYIKRQLMSILDQLSQNDEIIISDDGSTDNTVNIINELADNRINIKLNQGLAGPVGNFEYALNRASGDYIFLADQDDIWLPGKVDQVKALLDNYDLVLTDCRVVDNYGKVIHSSFFNYRKSKSGFWANIYKNSYMGCCMAFRKKVLDYALPFPKHIHMHDWWLGLLVEAKGQVCFYPKPLIDYVRHGGNASPTGETGYSYFRRLKHRLFLLINVVKRLSM